VIYDFNNIDDAKKVGEAFRLMGLSASTVDRRLWEHDVLTLVVDATLARVQRLEEALRHVLPEAEQS
jgi:hypothetical protein